MYNEFMESELIMTENKLSEQMEMQKNLMDAMELMRKRYTTSTEEYFAKLKKFGFDFSEEKIIEDYKKAPDAKAVIAAQEMPEEAWHKYGMIALKDNGTLSHIVEKPKTPDLAPSNLTSYGRYLLRPEVFDYLVPSNTGLDAELWTVDAITKLSEHGDVIVAKSRGKWITTGDPKNYFLAHLEYVLRNADYAEDVRKIVANS
jgi:UTP-glucose-1-phosphate uridylyltransferase